MEFNMSVAEIERSNKLWKMSINKKVRQLNKLKRLRAMTFYEELNSGGALTAIAMILAMYACFWIVAWWETRE